MKYSLLCNLRANPIATIYGGTRRNRDTQELDLTMLASTMRMIALTLAFLSLLPPVVAIARARGGIGGAIEFAVAAWWLAIGAATLAFIWVRLVDVAAQLFLAAVEGSKTIQVRESRILQQWMYGLFKRQQPSGDGRVVRAPAKAAALAVLAGLLGVLGAASLNSLSEIVLDRQIEAPEILDTWQKIAVATVLLVVASPLLETMVMAGLFKVLDTLRLDKIRASFVSAIAWGLLHSFTGHPIQFAAMTWLFWLLGLLYLRLRSASGFRTAYVATSAAHMLNNSLALSIIIATQRIH